MAMDLELCLYVVNSGAAKSKPKANSSKDSQKVVYDNFLRGLSNDIELYQAIQQVSCGHKECKQALLKSLQSKKSS